MIKIKKINNKLKVFLIVILMIFVIVGCTLATGMMLIKNNFSKINTIVISKAPEDIGIDTSIFKSAKRNSKSVESIPQKRDAITNILFLGIDSRDPKSDVGRSDSIMILTIDEKNDKLKVTSIMRDSLVSIDGHGEEKITHAHAYGGALLSLKTVNQNYNMNIMNYVQVDFFGLAKLIDYAGGVDINVTAEEVPVANSYVNEVARIENKQATPIVNPGLQTLNGSQAVAYSRIRYVGGDDFQRTERQRTVLSVLLKKLSTKSITDMHKVLESLLPCVETSLKTEEIMDFAKYILTHGMVNIEQSRIPYDGLYKYTIVNKMEVLTWNKEQTIDKLHEFIFGSKDN
jgi:LCP family protein required for cell wall assembly